MSPGDATTLLLVRHHVTNLLVRYLRAVDDHDLTGVLGELGDAEVSFGGPPSRGVEALTAAYGSAFAAGGRTVHLLHALEVTELGTRFTARANYQRWSLQAGAPNLTALGRYHAALDQTDGQLRLASLAIERTWQASATDPRPPSPTIEGDDPNVH